MKKKYQIFLIEGSTDHYDEKILIQPSWASLGSSIHPKIKEVHDSLEEAEKELEEFSKKWRGGEYTILPVYIPE